MSCGLPEVTPALAGSDVFGAAHDAHLLDELQDGLHAMAQPLTILHGTLWTANLHAGDQAGQKRSLDLSVRQVVRLAGLLGTMRDLLASHQEAPVRPIGNLADLMDEVREEMTGSLADLGVTLEITSSEVHSIAAGDAEHTHRALRAILRAMVSAAEEDARLELTARATSEGVCVVLAHTNQGFDSSARPDRLNFSIAQSNMTCQGGSFCSASWPRALSFTLPASTDASPDRASAHACVSVS